MGYINQYINKKKVQLGFIGSVRNLVVKRVPKLGETLTTTITVVEEIMKLTLVNAEIKVDEETIVTAEMKIALSEQEVLEPQLVTSINEGEG
jgi:predicted hotdog family 3-hydroxylacyl-ACP dehydratase